jgi:zinc/manganese transport system permease protein
MINALFDALQYEFVVNALWAGSFIAIIAAVVGYFLVARGLTFAGHALPNIGFAGAAGAVLLQLNPMYGLFAFTIGAGVGIGLMGKETRERDIAIGIIMTTALGLGLMFLSLYSGYAETVYNVLFGTVLGISRNDVWITALTTILALGVILLLFRPLLFSSFDPALAEARGLPVRALSILFLILAAIAVSVSVQIIGALLIFTLLVGPAATAMRITQRPLWAILLAVALSLCYTWTGIILGLVANDTWPVSFYITAISFGIYLPVRLLSPLWIGRGVRQAHQLM